MLLANVGTFNVLKRRDMSYMIGINQIQPPKKMQILELIQVIISAIYANVFSRAVTPKCVDMNISMHVLFV